MCGVGGSRLGESEGIPAYAGMTGWTGQGGWFDGADGCVFWAGEFGCFQLA